MSDIFNQAWEVVKEDIVKMPIGWPCKCGYHNLRQGTKEGQQVIIDICDECGEMPINMPTFVDDQEHGVPQKKLMPESKKFQEDRV